MKVAFCLFKYFPFGGMQRDFARIASACVARGCSVRVYTLSWQGEIPDALEVVAVPVTARVNHRLYARFSEWVARHLAQNPVELVVGFNKMPGLDFYYAADSCYAEKARTQRGWLYRTMPRYRHFRSFEEAVFLPRSHTRILLIAESQRKLFQRHYGTPDDRFEQLPPGVARDRMPAGSSEEVRAGLRREFSLGDDEKLLLMVGSGFVTKGLDRVLLGVHALPPPLRDTCRLIAIGQDNPRRFRRMAQRLGLSDRVLILGGRDDIVRFLVGADLLLHPAYVENTGTILLESLINGLPVLTTDVCGYAHFVEASGGGRVLPSPFRQEEFTRALAEMLVSEERDRWRQNGLEFGRTADIYGMPDHAAELICQQAQRNALAR